MTPITPSGYTRAKLAAEAEIIRLHAWRVQDILQSGSPVDADEAIQRLHIIIEAAKKVDRNIKAHRRAALKEQTPA